MRAFRPRLVALMARLRVRPTECEDLAQDVLWSVVDSLVAGKFRRGAALWTWICQIASNRIVSYWRDEGWRRAASIPAGPGGAPDGHDVWSLQGDSPRRAAHASGALPPGVHRWRLGARRLIAPGAVAAAGLCDLA
ncbi:MAG: sigma-70 family RNA polymerase sigma factor, partial [Jatrophihabitantaceae bacterium]